MYSVRVCHVNLSFNFGIVFFESARFASTSNESTSISSRSNPGGSM